MEIIIPGEHPFLTEIKYVTSRKHTLDMTRGSITRSIWIIAIPQIITNLTQGLFNVVDMFWVGKLGSESIAALAIGGTMMLVLFMMIMGVGTGASAMVARATGAGDSQRANRVAGNAIVLAIFISIPVAILGVAYSSSLFQFFGAEPIVTTLGAQYISILFLGSSVIFLTFVISAVCQGVGDAVTPMKIITLALVINTILDPFLIFGWGPFPRLGIAGAAWSTVTARLTASIILLRTLFSRQLRLRLRLKDVRPDWEIIRTIVRLGTPNSIQLSVRGLMGIAIMWIVASFGTLAVAAYGIGNRLFMLALFPGFGFGVAAASLVGQNLGAGKPDRSRRSAYAALSFYLTFLALIMAAFLIFPGWLILLFDRSPEVVAIGSNMLRIVALGLPFAAISLILNRSLSGAGDTIPPMVITLVSLWLTQIPLAYVLSSLSSLGINGVFLAIFIANLVAAGLAWTWFWRGNWATRKV